MVLIKQEDSYTAVRMTAL